MLHFLALDGLLDSGELKRRPAWWEVLLFRLVREGTHQPTGHRFRPMVLPDAFIETATQFQQYDQAGLNAKHIVGTVNKLMDRATVPAV